ncbi:hypothetical protein MRB53_039328 [Persea americana]|nr:hypothetical protein MRB53_039328 [Persea americana]
MAQKSNIRIEKGRCRCQSAQISKVDVSNCPAEVSSQYVSSLLMVAPFAAQEVHLVLTGDKVISELYIDMTTTMMRDFGIKVQKLSSHEYIIPQGQYTAPSQYEIESDASSATYPLALAALLSLEVHIPNIGSKSLQGDSQFAKLVLEPMGCHVQQTDSTTTVRGPPRGHLKAIPSIDMETMTDAFLTATVLAAATNGSMSITGIANQRVKECNRIAAMMHGLREFWRDIQMITELLCPFSLLGTIAPQKTLILEKGCTSKTWPEWWDVLANVFHVKLEGADHLPEKPRASINGAMSIIVVGMRGAGKSTMGALAAEMLGRPFIDLDDMLEADYGRKIPIIAEEDGWPAFRDLELKTLQKFIEKRSHGWVAACGGGIVETPAAIAALKAYTASGGIVLQIHRDINDIVAFLEADKTRPAWNKAAGSSAKRDFRCLDSTAAFEVTHWSSVLIFYKSTTRIYRLVAYVSKQLAILREASNLPIIFTVRTKSQGGRFPDDREDAAAELMCLAGRWGAEYIDFEMTWSEKALRLIRQSALRSRIIASHHDVAGELSFASATWIEHYKKGCQIGDVIKLIGKASSLADNYALMHFKQRIREQNHPPLIMINMGNQGTLSRILGDFLTPVTHELMPTKAAPGQLSVRQIKPRSSTPWSAGTQELLHLWSTYTSFTFARVTQCGIREPWLASSLRPS